MLEIQTAIVLLIVVAMAYWLYVNLTKRLEFLEHEVRWLRSELESLKPQEVRSKYD